MRVAGSVFGLLFVPLLHTGSLPAQTHTDRGAVLGGITGALLGAAVGNHNNEATEGALIGGALGVLSGAVLGSSRDAAESRWQSQQEQQYLAAMSQAVTPADVVTLTRSGVSDGVIVNQIRQRGVPRRLEVADVIALHNEGVSDVVITQMQQAPLATARVAAHGHYRAPVVIERRQYVAPNYWYPAPRYPYRYYGPPPGVQFGIRVSR